MYKRVLVPVDGSGFGECVFAHISRLTSESEAPRVDIVHVVEPITERTTRGLSSSVRDEEENRRVTAGEKYLVEVRNRLRQQGIKGAAFITSVLKGNAAETILNHAEEQDIELILMSSYGKSGVTRLLFGSVAEKVARLSPIPVLIVSPQGCGANGEHDVYRRILVPLDGSGFGECVLAHVKKLVREKDRQRAELLFVQTPSNTTRAVTLEGVEMQMEYGPLIDGEQYLSKISDRLRKEGIFVTATVVAGRPAEMILQHASRGIDLVIMSTRGRSGLTRLALGSVTDEVIRHSPVPVLAVSPSGCKTSAETA